ncbi:hypothetical protein Tco_0279541, partial [Tanacetum coccineum]
VTAALPSPLLPPLPPSLYIPPPVDHRDEIPESEQHLARDYGVVSTVDAEERRHGIRDVGYGIRDTWVDPTEAVLEIAHETHLQAHQTQLQLQGTLIQTQHQDQMVETLRVIRDMRREMSDMQTELLALRGQ